MKKTILSRRRKQISSVSSMLGRKSMLVFIKFYYHHDRDIDPCSTMICDDNIQQFSHSITNGYSNTLLKTQNRPSQITDCFVFHK